MVQRIQGTDLPLVQCTNPYRNIWRIYWKVEDSEESYYTQVYDHKPSIKEIKSDILAHFNAEIDRLILEDFTWKDMPVWLSMENQFNYKAAYDVAVQSEGKLLPLFKFGTTEEPQYYQFESLTDLQDFYLAAMTYVNKTLAKGWSFKDSFDWDAYEKELNQ